LGLRTARRTAAGPILSQADSGRPAVQCL